MEARLAREMPEVDLLEVGAAGRGPSATLRVVIDHPHGVDHGLCAAVTGALDRAGLLDRYSVEVSSPGPERPLRTLRHYHQAIGSRVQLTVDTHVLPGGRRSLSGTLVAADEGAVQVAAPEGPVEVPTGAIRRARVKQAIEERSR